MSEAQRITRALGGRWHGAYGTARCVAHDDRNPSLSIRDGDDRLLVRCYAGCDARDVLAALRRAGHLDDNEDHGRAAPVSRRPPTPKANDPDRSSIARALWRRAVPAEGTVAEVYLRARGYAGAIPATIRFLPARGEHAPAMISAFGIATEPRPGELHIEADAISAVHLTRLQPDGSGKAEAAPDRPAKIMLGRAAGSPIVLAPPNDLLGLAIVEGIETGLSVASATGLGVWAAGSASLLPALAAAVPDYIDFITCAADPDPAGQTFGTELVARLARRGLASRLGCLEVGTG